MRDHSRITPIPLLSYLPYVPWPPMIGLMGVSYVSARGIHFWSLISGVLLSCTDRCFIPGEPDQYIIIILYSIYMCFNRNPPCWRRTQDLVFCGPVLQAQTIKSDGHRIGKLLDLPGLVFNTWVCFYKEAVHYRDIHGTLSGPEG